MIKKIMEKYNNLSVYVKASIWFMMCSFMQKGINVVITPIITRLLTTDEYGRYNVFNSWLGIVTVFVSMRIAWGVYTQGLVKFEEDRDKFSSSLQGLTLVLVLIWTIIYLLFHNFWNNIFSLTTVQMLAMLVMIWATAAYDFWAAEQRVKLTYKALVAVTLLSSVAKPAVGILLVLYSEDKVTAFILGLALVEIVFFTGLFIAQMKKGKAFYSGFYWKYALTMCVPLVPHYLSQTVLNSSDRIMIEKMCSSDEAGIYSLAYSLSIIMTLFNTALSQTVNPWIYKKIKEKQIGDITSIAYMCLMFVAVVNIILIVLAPEAVRIFAPEEYYDAIWIVPPVAMSVFFMFSYGLFADFEFYFEKTVFISSATAVGAILNIILNYIFIDKFGYYAAGYTTLICYVLYALGHYCFMTRICRKEFGNNGPYNPKVLLSMSLIFLAAGVAVMFTYEHPVIRYSLAAVIAVMVFIFRKKIYQSIINLIKLRKKS